MLMAIPSAAERLPSDMLIDIALCEEPFHTATGTAFADIIIEGHRETWPIRSKRFRAWLRPLLLPGESGGRERSGDQVSATCSKRGRSSTARNGQSTSAPPSVPDASISILPMSTGAPSTSDLMDGR
jgi:hypothetical protein